MHSTKRAGGGGGVLLSRPFFEREGRLLSSTQMLQQCPEVHLRSPLASVVVQGGHR